MNAMCHRANMVDNFEARVFAEVVDTCDVDQIIEGEFVAAELRDLTKIGCGDRAGCLAPKFKFVMNFLAKRFDQRVEQLLASHIVGRRFSKRLGGWKAAPSECNLSSECFLESFGQFRLLVPERA